ncbi:hypothetical protein [Micromonospora sp. WMMD1082]|uniref:hypothetical protein n=1 Tax=Micromonospora sp. WMMD1082 TaxID=3016104 RepID=UPI0024176A4E|nr:hypothetical protein [Micromonospora sp. WMMD1082]MDG4796187.1 hypothetical protein [Micromonospora sp. WMMD1082]
MPAEPDPEPLDDCGRCTLIPSAYGPVRAVQSGCSRHSNRAVAAAADVAPDRHRRLADPVETLDTVRRRRREPDGLAVTPDPVAQAESLRQVAEIDAQLAEEIAGHELTATVLGKVRAELTGALRELGRERAAHRETRARVAELERHVARLIGHVGAEATAEWACGAVQHDAPPELRPYRCSEPSGHDGDHRAVIDELTVDTWPRREPR